MDKVTLDTIAQALNVSKVAVHKALNDKKGVSETLRKRIKAYAESVGYTVKNKEVTLENRKFIFFVDRDFFLTPSEQFYSTIFYYLSFECNQVNSALHVSFLEKDNTLENVKKALNSFGPDGIFFAGDVDKEVMKHFQNIDIPIVFIDYYTPLYPGCYVYSDNYHAAYRVTKHLIDKGHRSIGFIGDIKRTSSIADRYFGYMKALEEEGIDVKSSLHINQNLEKSDDILNVDLNKGVTAYVCHCDAAAQWLYTALSHQNFSVPKDVSVVSFDNTLLCESMLPRLTSIGPDKETYAKKAFDAMGAIIKKESGDSRILVPTQFSKRESVRKSSKAHSS